jgi:hypothetical protein
MIKGLRKVAGASLEVRKDSISIFASDEIETRIKELIEIHRFLCRLGSARNRAVRTEVIAVRRWWAKRRLCPDKTGDACDLFRFGVRRV